MKFKIIVECESIEQAEGIVPYFNQGLFPFENKVELISISEDETRESA